MNHAENLDIECFEKTYELGAKYTFKPITYITSLFRSEDEVSCEFSTVHIGVLAALFSCKLQKPLLFQVLKFHARMKLSSFDRDLALFLIYHKCDGTEGKPPVNRLK